MACAIIRRQIALTLWSPRLARIQIHVLKSACIVFVLVGEEFCCSFAAALGQTLRFMRTVLAGAGVVESAKL